jgi:Tfp pilus assembly protein PilX
MLTRHQSATDFVRRAARQAGVVMVIALIVLVAMTLGAVALIRSVDTANLIAGNLAFQQSAIHSADVGFETAITWLQNNKGSEELNQDDQSNGYIAAGLNPANNPNASIHQSWDDFWNGNVRVASFAYPQGPRMIDQAGNSFQYVIHRLCNGSGPQAGAGCSDSLVVTAENHCDETTTPCLKAFSPVYYRITVRVTGPKNTVSYVQTVVSM